MHSISDLTTYCRKTTGDVPSRLVGASTTVVGSKMYLFGGRLVTERKMVSDMYVLDLRTFTWEKHIPPPEDDVPGPRYFHSADTWNNQLIICGGMGHKADASNPEDLCVLNDVRFFNLITKRWLPAASTNSSPDLAPDFLVPKPRYAHLSSITADRLFIIGGQDLSNIWLDDVHVYDLLGKTWVERRNYPRHVGTYRSIAVAADQRVRLPQEEIRTGAATPTLGPVGTRFQDENKAPPNSRDFTQSELLVHLPYSAPSTDDFPNDIYLYSNYNFTDVKREFEVFSPLPDTDFTINDRSSAMMGTSFPPGLRFPSGAMLGTHFIIAGTYLAHTYQSFSIWALDLLTMQWSRIDPGGAVSTGSWFRGCLWGDANKFLIFGNRNGNLVEDYNRRLLSWDHVAVIDLESFGIYQPPPLKIDIPMQELGLAALEEAVLTDFEIVCDDGRNLKCSRKILEERWPWFREQLQKFMQKAQQTVETLSTSSMHIGLPDLPGVTEPSSSRPDPRLTPRSFQLSEPYPITLALLQYFYSLALITPLQQAPAVLSQLLVLSSTYQITHLQSLVKHAMHRMLSNSTSVGVYEVATLCSCRSLQIRALKTVMVGSSSRDQNPSPLDDLTFLQSYSQKRPSGRSRQDSRSGGGGAGGSGRNQDLNGGGGVGPAESSFTARPRGTSDAPFRGATDPQSGTAGTGYITKNNEAYSPNISATLEDEFPADTFFSGDRKLPPPAFDIFFHRNLSMSHNRTTSVISTSTDHEIRAIAELMSPVVEAQSTFGEQQEQLSTAIDDALDTFIEPSIHHALRSQRSGYCQDPSELSLYPPPSPADSVYPDSQSDLDLPSDNEVAYPPKPSPYLAFHLPRPRPRPVSVIRDSDTPSLSSSTSYSSLASVSRSHSLRNSPPTSPASLLTPVEYLSGSLHLEIIEERYAEDLDVQRRVSVEPVDSQDVIEYYIPKSSSQAITVNEASLTGQNIPTLKRRIQQVEHLRLKSISSISRELAIGSRTPAATVGMTTSLRSRSESPTSRSVASSDSDSGTLSPVPQTAPILGRRVGSAISINKFLGGSSKAEKAATKAGRTERHQWSPLTPSPSFISFYDEGVKSPKQGEKWRKVEEKQRKKYETKAKTERLALALKEKAQEREARGSIYSGKSNNKKPLWADTPALFGGLSSL